jgi:hypothetical protein
VDLSGLRVTGAGSRRVNIGRVGVDVKQFCRVVMRFGVGGLSMVGRGVRSKLPSVSRFSILVVAFIQNCFKSSSRPR